MPASDYDEQTKFKAPELAASITDVPNVGYVEQAVTSTDPLGGRALNFFTDTVEPLLKGAAKIDEISTKEGAQKELEAEAEAYRSGSPTNISRLRQRQKGLQEAHERMSLGPDEDRYMGENRQVFQENVAKIETELNLIATQLENAQNQKVIDPAQAKDRYWSKVSELVNRDPYYAKDIIGIANQNLTLKNLPTLWAADASAASDAASDIDFIWKDTYKNFSGMNFHSSDFFAIHSLPTKQLQIQRMNEMMNDRRRMEKTTELIAYSKENEPYIADQTLEALETDGGIIDGKYVPSTIEKYIKYTLDRADTQIYTTFYEGEGAISGRSDTIKKQAIIDIFTEQRGFLDSKFGHLLKGNSEVQKRIRKNYTDALNDRQIQMLDLFSGKNFKDSLETRQAHIDGWKNMLLGERGAILEAIVDITQAGQQLAGMGGDLMHRIDYMGVMDSLQGMLMHLNVAKPLEGQKQKAEAQVGTVITSLKNNPAIWAQLAGGEFEEEEQHRVVEILEKIRKKVREPDDTPENYYGGGTTSGTETTREKDWMDSHERVNTSGKTLIQNSVESTLSKIFAMQDPEALDFTKNIPEDAKAERRELFENSVTDAIRYVQHTKDESKKVQGWSRLIASLSIDGHMSGGITRTINAPDGLKGLTPAFISEFESGAEEWAQYLNQRLLDSDDDILYKLDINQDGTLRVGARKAMVPRFDKKTGKEIPSPFQDTGKRGQLGGPVLVTEEINQVNKFLKAYSRITGQSILGAHKAFYDKYFTEAFSEMLNKNQLDEYTEDTAMAGEDVKLDETGLASGDLQTKQYLEEQQAEKKSPIASLVESVIPSVAAADFKSKAGQETLIKTINNFAKSGVNIKPKQFLTLAEAVAQIESGGKGKTAVGKSKKTKKIYYGTYQMGDDAIGDAAADLKEVVPDHKTFLDDEEMQERFYGAYINKSNKHLMNVSAIKKKLEMLAGAQLGMGNVVKFINGDKSFKDGNGKGIQYFIDRYIKYRDSK